MDLLAAAQATLERRQPTDDSWLYELKFDGHRMQTASLTARPAGRRRNTMAMHETVPSPYVARWARASGS